MTSTRGDYVSMSFGFMGTSISHPLPFISNFQFKLPEKEEMERFIEKQIKGIGDEI